MYMWFFFFFFCLFIYYCFVILLKFQKLNSIFFFLSSIVIVFDNITSQTVCSLFLFLFFLFLFLGKLHKSKLSKFLAYGCKPKYHKFCTIWASITCCFWLKVLWFSGRIDFKNYHLRYEKKKLKEKELLVFLVITRKCLNKK